MKKTVSLILALLMCFSVVGCGADKTPSVSDNAVDNTAETTGTDAEGENVESEAAEYEEKAKEVIALIDTIGTVTLESEEVIKAARDSYAALSVEAQAMVTNYNTLESAETEFSELMRVEKERIFNENISKFDIDQDKVEGITWYMHNNMPEYIDTRSYIIPYIGVQNDNAWICIRYNYTADDWVFWKKLTIVTDNEKYIKTVGAFDTVRDNDGGVVWEWYDECLNYNQTLESAELLMLKDIAESTETIIRFEGDEYYEDLIVTDTDKAIIKDVLALYSGLVK